ncbi:hypothetical protein HDV00_004736 [Rhizophlyctis rosea]|nr:hypothetical protein HDV00_004736 [Rhizophlyctis rosea]
MLNQLKIITTAIFSVIILSRSISIRKWIALFILLAGVLLVQPGIAPPGAEKSDGIAVVYIGILAGIGAAVISGFAGVYVEKLLKDESISLWLRNVHLGTYSAGFAMLAMLGDGIKIPLGQLFRGYTIWTWLAIICWAASGLLVAAVVKYVGMIQKNFAACFAVVLGAVFSISIGELGWSLQILGGIVLVSGATALYNLPDNYTPTLPLWSKETFRTTSGSKWLPEITCTQCLLVATLLATLTSAFYPVRTVTPEPGPLQFEDLNCILAYRVSEPLTKVWQPANGSHTVKGVTFDDGTPPVIIFIMFKDRISQLMESIRSYHRYIRTPFEIVILDDNSTYPQAANFLSRLSNSDITVYHSTHEWGHFNDLYSIWAEIIANYMTNATGNYYIMTDADNPLDSAPHNILEVYSALLDHMPSLYNVAAALRWDDWNPEVFESYVHEAAFINKEAKCFLRNDRCYYYNEAPIDTTFAMYRKGTQMGRLKGPTVRMLPPLAVRHMDWYIPKLRNLHRHEM